MDNPEKLKRLAQRERDLTTNMRRWPSVNFRDDATYFYVFDLPELNGPVLTEESLRTINRVALSIQNPQAGGHIRNYGGMAVGNVRLMDASEVPEAMRNFLRNLNEAHQRRMDPVWMAVQAHHRLVQIHPFMDGNGRSARLLMNFILRREGLSTVLLEELWRPEYMSALSHRLVCPAVDQRYKRKWHFTRVESRANTTKRKLEEEEGMSNCSESMLKQADEEQRDVTSISTTIRLNKCLV
ncbi:hypothetical protein niasHT_015426 [Heterodera trifolii]|uniref:Fido domain-containing protein n=1 Tax=Heterodera trifolii TaxID=157864 RepID=A0ABD2L1V5_9BILA